MVVVALGCGWAVFAIRTGDVREQIAELTAQVDFMRRFIASVMQSTLFERAVVNGKTPKAGILVEVKEAFLQCAKALRRSKLWSNDYRVPHGKLPTLGRMLVDQTNAEMTVEQSDQLIDQAYRERLY